MALPTNYTAATFESYLKYEVLQETAFNLDWAVDLPITPVTWDVILVEAKEGAETVQVRPLKYPIEKGTTLSFVHRTTAAVLTSADLIKTAFPDDEIIFLSNPLDTVTWPSVPPSVNFRASTTTPTDIATEEPIFTPIIRDTLAALGVADITTITGMEGLHRLRTRGRVELWRRVMSFTSFDYPVTTEGSTLVRSQIYESAVQQYNIALQDWNDINNAVDVEVQASERRTVKAVW